MVLETTLPATVQAAKSDEALTENHLTSTPNTSWETPHCRDVYPFQRAQRTRMEPSASSTMANEANSEDDETTKLKKKKNREAAQRCRLRKKQRYEELKKEKLDLTSKETTMKYKVSQLKKLQEELSRELSDHIKSSNCKLNSTKCGLGLSVSPFMIDPAVTQDLLGKTNLPSVHSLLLPSAHVSVAQHNPARMTASATTLAPVGYDTPSATYCNNMQHSPIMAHNHSNTNNLEEIQEPQPASEDSLPMFELLMSKEKSVDLISNDESISGELVVQSVQVLNNPGMSGPCDNIRPSPQHLNTKSMAGPSPNTRMNNLSMGGLCDNTHATTVSHLENNNRQTGIMSINSEQSLIPMNGEITRDNANEQASSQTMSEPEGWIIKTEAPLPNSLFQNQVSVGNSDFEQSKDGITEVFGSDLSSDYFTENVYMTDNSLELNLS